MFGLFTENDSPKRLLILIPSSISWLQSDLPISGDMVSSFMEVL